MPAELTGLGEVALGVGSGGDALGLGDVWIADCCRLGAGLLAGDSGRDNGEGGLT